MIATAPRLVYLHEPFKLYDDPRFRPANLWTQFPDWFLHVGAHNAATHEPAIERTLRLTYDWRQSFGYRPSPGQAWVASRNWAAWTARRLCGYRPVMKDPLALFSAEWLARRFGLDVVVMIRHPAAFASSIKVKHWSFDFNHWLRQDQLMNTLLQPFADDVRRLAARNDDLVDQAILQWRAFHHVIRGYRDRHPNWHFVRHEDLSLDPTGGFRDLFAELGLPFTPACKQAVRASTDSENPKESREVARGGDEYKLNSVANVKSWRGRLTEEEVRRVRQGTQDLYRHFYSDADWE